MQNLCQSAEIASDRRNVLLITPATCLVTFGRSVAAVISETSANTWSETKKETGT